MKDFIFQFHTYFSASFTFYFLVYIWSNSDSIDIDIADVYIEQLEVFEES